MSDVLKALGLKGTTKAPKGPPRSKRSGANNSPARQRYWSSHRLRDRKVRNLVRCCGMTRAEATALWNSTRHTRIKTYG